MSGIGIITNPHSKLNKRNPGRTALLGYILGAKGQLEVTNSLDDLARVARTFKEQGINVLAINGGDGTICRTLTAFQKEYGETPLPKIAVLKGGTINVLANNLGVRGTPEQILYRLVEWHAGTGEMPTQRLRSLVVEGNLGFLFGDGVAASFLKEYYKHKSGPIGAAWWAIRVWASRFFGSKLYDSVVKDDTRRLVADGQPPVDHTTCAVFCSTVKRMPLGVKLFPAVEGRLDRFECVSFTFPARDAVWAVPRSLFWRQGGAYKDRMSLVCTRDLVVNAQGPFDYTLDGELYTSREPSLSIAMGPELEFVTL
jgi:hypothetical protein